ncbi:isochorismatase family protein [Paraburkholderia sediminicola]|nr:isochorismatase family protein [Paraburkholderia sediminicola]
MNINPAKTALLVLDFQGTILGSLPDADPLVARVAGAIDAMRAAGGAVVYVRVAFTQEDLSDFPAHSSMGRRMNSLGEAVHVDAAATQVDARLAPRPGDIVVRKRRVGPFSTTDLEQQLRAKGIDTLLICGIHTSGCVLSCVREAHDLDYRTIVLADCCADPDLEVNDFLINKIFPKQSEVVNFSDIQNTFPAMLTSEREYVEIHTLYAAYNQAIDSGDADGWAATFVEDGTFHHPSRAWRGREELHRFVEKRSTKLLEDPITDQRHWNDAIKITFFGTRATVSCDLLVVGTLRSNGSSAIAARGRYEDTLVKSTDGWRFVERRLTVQ